MISKSFSFSSIEVIITSFEVLCEKPRIIFADEPTGNLDEQTAHEIEQLLFRLNREMQVTLVLVTHDLELAAQCQRHFILHDGQLCEQQG